MSKKPCMQRMSFIGARSVELLIIRNCIQVHLIIQLNVVGYSKDSSPMGSWPSNPSFNWQIQRSVEGVSEAGAGAVGSPLPGARDPRRFRKSFDGSLNSPIE